MKRAMMLEKRMRPIGRLRILVLGSILGIFRELNFWMKHEFCRSWQCQPDYVIWSNPADSVHVFFKGRNIYHKFSVGIVRRHVDVLICGEREAEDEKDNQKRSDNSNYDEKVVKRLVHYIFHRKDEKDTLNTWPGYHFEPRFLHTWSGPKEHPGKVCKRSAKLANNVWVGDLGGKLGEEEPAELGQGKPCISESLKWADLNLW